jgi:DNA polymerase I
MYNLITDIDELQQYIDAIDDRFCALDFETTSLRPQDGRVRLVSLFDGTRGAVVDFDALRGGFEACAGMFSRGEWIVFNSGFELRWFIAAGCPKTRCRDVGFLRRAILGGGRYSLKQVVAWDLNRDMDKTEQTSNWAAPELTQSQLDYAFKDAVDTWDLFQHWYDRSDDMHLKAWSLFDGMVPAVIEMEDSGMLVDTHRHRQLARHWASISESKVKLIRETVPVTAVENINSGTHWSDFFAREMPDNILSKWPRTEKTGTLSMTSSTLSKIGAHFFGHFGENPITTLVDALRDYKKMTKYLNSFGDTLADKAQMHDDNRVRCRFNIGAAKTCRFSSTGPNLQQIPRDLDLLGEHTSVRSSFIAPPGKQLVSLDYSGIELRVLALLSKDDQLLHDVVHGDVHAEVASVIAGHPIDKSTPEGKAARTAAKAVSFGIIYGSGAGGLSVTMRTSSTKAQKYIDFWAERFSNAFEYRNIMLEQAAKTRYIRVVDGGTIYMGKNPDLPKCANYPVQRAALSVMARAIARHKQTLDDHRQVGQQRQTLILSTIHDALIDEASSDDARQCLSLMEEDMKAGYLDMFPGAPTERLVEGGIGINWGSLGD